MTETETYARMLCGHLRQLVARAREIPLDKFDWAIAPPAPTARILVTHAYQWLVCDRQHIETPDASKHPRVPEPPEAQQALCDALSEETARWETLILSLTPGQLDEVRHQFNNPEDWSIRGILHHMCQNCVYKHGQLSTIYFALGLDGEEPYTAPFPNPIYDEVFGPKS
jgi:hypothetical protein